MSGTRPARGTVHTVAAHTVAEWPGMPFIDVGPDVRITTSPSSPGGFVFWHLCPGTNVGGWTAWRAAALGLHTITGTPDRPTVEPSILVDCCNINGFLRDGKWVSA